MNPLPESLGVVIIGASGDLARRKIIPALFALYCQGHLPADFRVYGFARSALTDAQFREKVTEHLTCRYVPGESCQERMAEFLARCYYVRGDYASADSFLDLFQRMNELDGRPDVCRLFYMAIPPSTFMQVARSLGASGLIACSPREPWSRVVIEKPFGRDRASSDELAREMAESFTEEQTYRIDHYLGKEMVQNIMVLRFANLIFEPIWSREFIESVQITWKEDLGVEGRGGYFDSYGIIRDVMQNHLLQILAIVAMEPPIGLDSHPIRDEKVKVLKAIVPVGREDCVVGQYTRGLLRDRPMPGYREDGTIPRDSRTPTFAAVVLGIRNRRWDGVPFLVTAGKGMDSRLTEVRVRFRPVPANLFAAFGGGAVDNELVIRIQPDECVSFRVINKVPGPGLRLATRDLDLTYKEKFSEIIPDAYENLLLDVMRGDRTLFIRGDELAAAWDIFTPLLHELDLRRFEPDPYAFGSRGPESWGRLIQRHGIEVTDG